MPKLWSPSANADSTGGDLKRFNLIVDNRRGFAYFRPNQHLAEPFRNPEYFLVRVLALATVAVGLAAAWLVRRRTRQPGHR